MNIPENIVMNLDPGTTQAIMIDMQERLLAAMPDPEDLVRRCKILVKGLSVLRVPVTVTQQYTKGLGNTAARLMQARMCEESFGEIIDGGSMHSGSAEAFFDKITYSCWADPQIRKALEAHKGRKTMLLFGVETHVCVWQTARDLLEAGYNVQIICDCVESRRAIDKEIALRRMEQAGAVLTTIEACLFELLHTAGTPEFKAISKLVK